MGAVISFIILAFICIWAYRLEMNTAKANESLKRIEAQLEKLTKEKK